MDSKQTYTAFVGDRILVSAGLETMLRRTKEHLDESPREQVLIFEDHSEKDDGRTSVPRTHVEFCTALHVLPKLASASTGLTPAKQL